MIIFVGQTLTNVVASWQQDYSNQLKDSTFTSSFHHFKYKIYKRFIKFSEGEDNLQKIMKLYYCGRTDNYCV